jgi:hypothetical protein
VESFTPNSDAQSSASRASGTSTPLFSSPASSFSFIGGVVTSQVAKCGLVYCCDVVAICGGTVGPANADGIQHFCFKPARQCSIAKHMSSKVLLQMGHLYIECPRSQHAWNKASIDDTKLPGTCNIDALSSSEKPYDVRAA